jgi:DNA-directed RNA polymerase subunit N (RpoN/RPB10)
MNYYREYPIRCKTCNEQIACFSFAYEELVARGYSLAKALDEIGITNYCSRISMMNPVIVTYNMERRDLIEGVIPGVGITTETIQKAPQSTGMRISTQKTNVKMRADIKPLAPTTPSSVAISIGVEDQPATFTEPIRAGIPTINGDTKNLEVVDVGAGKKTEILKGQTFLAR